MSSASSRSGVIGMQMRPRPYGHHEVDRRGRHLFGGDGQVALVLAILVVDDDDHPAASNASTASSTVENGAERTSGARTAVGDDAMGAVAMSASGAGDRQGRDLDARATYLPSTSHSMFTLSPGFRRTSVVCVQV